MICSPFIPTSSFLSTFYITFITLAPSTLTGGTCCTAMKYDRSHTTYSEAPLSITMSLFVMDSDSTSDELMYYALCHTENNLVNFLSFYLQWDSSLF